MLYHRKKIKEEGEEEGWGRGEGVEEGEAGGEGKKGKKTTLSMQTTSTVLT